MMAKIPGKTKPERCGTGREARNCQTKYALMNGTKIMCEWRLSFKACLTRSYKTRLKQRTRMAAEIQNGRNLTGEIGRSAIKASSTCSVGPIWFRTGKTVTIDYQAPAATS